MGNARVAAPAPSPPVAAPFRPIRRAPYPPTPFAVTRATLHAHRSVVIRDRLIIDGKAAGTGTLSGYRIRGVTSEEIVKHREAFGLRSVDRVIDRQVMLSDGRIATGGFTTDYVRGHRECAQVLVSPDYRAVPKVAPPMPRWNQDVFVAREDALIYAAFVHSLAAPRVVRNVGIIAVTAWTDRTARALIDVAHALATGCEAPTEITLGERSRDFLSGVTCVSDADPEDDDDDDDDEDDAEDDDDEDDQILGPDELLGLCVVRDSKTLVRAHPRVPIATINMSPEDLDPTAPVRSIRLKRGLCLDHEEVELAAASHFRLYGELLARVRDAGAPMSFDRLLDFLRRTSSL